MATNNTITTSITVNFAPADADGILMAEIDDREDGLNLGNTSFRPGDDVGFLVYKTPDVVIDQMVSTLGSTTGAGSGTRTVTEFITFADSNEASVGYPIASISDIIWFGTSGGAYTISGSTISLSAKAIAVAEVTYTTNFTGYKLTNVPPSYAGKTTFSVLIFIAGHQETA